MRGGSFQSSVMWSLDILQKAHSGLQHLFLYGRTNHTPSGSNALYTLPLPLSPLRYSTQHEPQSTQHKPQPILVEYDSCWVHLHSVRIRNVYFMLFVYFLFMFNTNAVSLCYTIRFRYFALVMKPNANEMYMQRKFYLYCTFFSIKI